MIRDDIQQRVHALQRFGGGFVIQDVLASVVAVVLMRGTILDSHVNYAQYEPRPLCAAASGAEGL